MRIDGLLLRSLRCVRTGILARTTLRIVVRNLALLAGFVLLQAWGALVLGADNKIALLVSDHTYAYFANAYETTKCSEGSWTLGTLEYKRYFMGWEKILEDANQEYTVLTDAQISSTNLQKFRVLILCNNFWLDDSQTKIIAEWVRKGGHLLATYGSGYSGADNIFKKGGTNGLHELWGDPSGKVNSSSYLGNPVVDVEITQDGGPTNGFDAGEVFHYEWNANVLIRRPGSSRDINAFFLFNGQASGRPAIFNNQHSKGLVVYYAFAPEYILSLAYDLAGHCGNDTRYAYAPWQDHMNDLAGRLSLLMISTLNYLISQ